MPPPFISCRPRPRARVGRGKKNASADTRLAREENHTLGYSDRHLPGSEIRHEDDLLPDNFLRLGIRLSYSGENRAFAERAGVEDELQEFRTLRNGLAAFNDADAEIDFIEIRKRDLALKRLDLPIPCSLFPVPYSLFPTPYSLFLIPYSLFPIPYSLFLIPYSLFPIPCSLFLVPYSLSK